MKTVRLFVAVVLVGLAATGCQRVTEDEGSAPVDDAAANQTAPSPSKAPAEDASNPVTEAPRITGDELAEALTGGEVFLLDVRRPDELEELGTVEGYTNIPIEELADRLDELPRDRPILTA